jgi:hypothetical protein
MNLYLISRQEDDEADWDTYIAAVVAAPSESAARKIRPNGGVNSEESCGGWTPPSKVVVKYLGVAGSKIKEGVVLDSYKAG